MARVKKALKFSGKVLGELAKEFEVQGHEPKNKYERRLRIRFKFESSQFKVRGVNMTFEMKTGQSVKVKGSPVLADLVTPSLATLSDVIYSTSDPKIFSVDNDSEVAGGAVLTATGAGTAVLTETALATEPDGKTTETISGTVTIVITQVVGPAAGIVFEFGTPTP